MRKNYALYFFIFCTILLNTLVIFNCYKTKSNQETYFRLHIVANSNSIEDQITKLNVSKKINSYISKLTDANSEYTKDEVKDVITKNIDSILEVANNEISLNNKDYTSYANIGKIQYDEKQSGTLIMKEGIYDSVQIVLGEGKGENFWTLIFPYAEDYSGINNTDTDVHKKQNKILEDDIDIHFGIVEDIKRIVKLFS